jgi:hypothetical protein
LTLTVSRPSTPSGEQRHCFTAAIADCANAPFVARTTVISPMVPSEGLTVWMPEPKPCDHAIALKIV